MSFAQSEFRGFWADAYHDGFRNAAQIDLMVARAVAGNHNAILPEVLAFHDTEYPSHGAFWNSAILPKSTSVPADFDPLAYLVQRAHANGIEVHPWLVPLRVSIIWPPPGNSCLASHPEWLMVPWADIGTIAKVGNYYTIDPGSPDVQEYLISIVRELVTSYEIDGIHWDDSIGYPQTDAGYPADTSYPKSSLARFQQITGYIGTPPPVDPAWNDFRRRTVDEIVRRCWAETAAIANNPCQPLRHTATLIAGGGSPPPGDFTHSRAYGLFQNWELWLRMGWLDAGCPTLFYDEGDSLQAQRYRQWVDWLMAQQYPRHLFIGVSAYLNDSWELCSQIEYMRGAGADGASIAFYRDLELLPCLATPAMPPSMPWRDPATALEGTLWGQVTKAVTDAPFDDATVLLGSLAPVQTDGNGHYVVTMIPAASGGTSYTATAYAVGVGQHHVTVTIMPGALIRQNFVLAPVYADCDHDGDVDLDDFNDFAACLLGPGGGLGVDCACFDSDDSGDVDLGDFAELQRSFTGP